MGCIQRVLQHFLLDLVPIRQWYFRQGTVHLKVTKL